MEKIYLKSRGLTPAISVLSVAASLDSDEVLIKCRKETYHNVKKYFAGFHTEPPICVGKRFVGIPVKYSSKTPASHLVLLPSNTVFVWWPDEKTLR